MEMKCTFPGPRQLHISVLVVFNRVVLQDTKRNLHAVDKMLERYKDIGEQKAAVVHAVCTSMCLL